MAIYTAGLSSGFDWTSMISSLMKLERQPITTMEGQKTTIQTRQSAWKQVNTKLASLKTASAALSELDDFNLYTSSSSITGTSDKKVSDLIGFSVGSTATQGSYSIKVGKLAQAQKLSSTGFASTSTALGLKGDLLINGRAVTLTETDTLKDLQTKINATNSGTNASGVTASIFTAGTGEYRLSITSQATGADGIAISNASADDILSELGLADSTAGLANAITGGVRSREFSSSTQAIGSLLGLSSAATGLVTVGGHALDEANTINLATDSLEDVRTKLVNAGVDAKIVADTSSGSTTYTLQIDGTQSLTDANNVLQTLGLLKQGFSDVSGLTGSGKNTADGVAIKTSTLLVDIDGYSAFTAGDKIAISGSDHSGAALAASEFTVTATSTVDDLLTAVEAAYGGTVSASINSSGALVLEDRQAGASSLALNLSATKADGTTPIGLDFGAFTASTLRKREVVAGQDAEFTLDGVAVKRSSNQITDVIDGVTLTLAGADPDAEINLNISRDSGAVKTLINKFVTEYNNVMKYIGEQSTATTGEDGELSTPTLYADSTLQSIKSEVRNNILGAVAGVSGSLTHLSLIGIEIDEEGVLAVDDKVLSDALETNFDDVVNLFATRGSSSNSSLTYVSSGNDTASGSYEVEITQAATQASLTGANAIGSLVNGDNAITITDHAGKTATVALEAGWNLTAVVNALNSELSQNYAEIRVGANKLYADNAQAGAVTAATTWNSVYDASGTGAGLANADVINFSGTNRSGKAVSGSYTVADVASGKVGDLLSEIEETYGEGYDAYIDSSGRIAIKDKTVGDSQVTLNVGVTKNLDFGAVDVDPSGADGSHEGRYSLDVTAVNEGGKLKIYNNDYGSYGLTVTASGTADELGLNTGSPVVGTDVAGRIRSDGSSTWQTMTGKGQSLTGDADQGVEELVIKYTGTALGTYDFGLSAGVGAKMNRSVYYMTDSVSGYVADKQKNFTNQIASLDKRIDKLESRMEIRQNTLYNQFIAMETLLSKLQAQQSYLSSLTSKS